MQAHTPQAGAPPTPARPHFARRSLLMLPAFLAAFVVASLIEQAAMRGLGLTEGDLLLMAHSVAAWTAELVVVAIKLAPPLLGMWFALAAVQRDGRRLGWVGLVLNAAILGLVLYGFVDDIRMSY